MKLLHMELLYISTVYTGIIENHNNQEKEPFQQFDNALKKLITRKTTNPRTIRNG